MLEIIQISIIILTLLAFFCNTKQKTLTIGVLVSSAWCIEFYLMSGWSGLLTKSIAIGSTSYEAYTNKPLSINHYQ